jgi:hypothetical protein
MQYITGGWVSQAIYVAARLGVADHLTEGPKSADELARATGAHGPSLYRVLRVLASFGIFTEDREGRFAMTALAIPLRTDAADSIRAIANLVGDPWHWQAWADVLHSVQTGESAFRHVHGQSEFEFFGHHPEAGEVFAQAMTSFAVLTSGAIVAAYDFAGIDTLVDVGGGQGSLLIAILKANPGLRGVLFDLPPVVESARGRLTAAGVADRCEVVAGDLFKGVPAGGDAYLVKNIVHGLEEGQAVDLLRNCAQGMRANGRVLVVETVVPPGNEPSLGKLMDLQMLVMTDGGRERTEPEYSALLEMAGLRLTRVVSTPSPYSVIEGTRA